jgi:hypothetical protein
MNSFEAGRLTPEDISDEVLLAETKRLKIEAPAQLKQDMLHERALRVFVCRESRREEAGPGRLCSEFAKSHAISLRIP